ncbi:MAG TPA: YCF48-related protein, partial [Ignavibacteria bacterium]|nr:YCF48-related protein [Ignavibacteria bacterium]
LMEDSTISINDIKFADMQTGYFGGHLSYYSNKYNYFKLFKTTNGGLNIDSIFTGFIFPVKGIEIRNSIIFIYGGRSFPGMYGLLYSTNGGLNWLQSDIKKVLEDVSYLNANNFYATEVLNGSSVLLYKSTNNGINWNSVAGNMKNYDFEFINTSTGLTVGPKGQVYKTTNSGNNWLPQTSTIADYMNSVDFVNDNTGYACDNYKLFKTTNGGNNWNSLFTAFLYVIDYVDANTGYFGGENCLFKTTNGGATITEITFVNIPGKLTEIQFLDANTGYILGKYNTAWKTTDGGNNWSLLSGYGTGSHYCMKFSNENLGFIGLYDLGLGSGVSRTTNGGLNWSFMPMPEAGDYIWDFCFLNSNTGFFTTDGKIFKTTNSGINWFSVYETNYLINYASIFSIQFVNDNTGYATYAQGKIVKTTDAGNTWAIHTSVTDNWFTDMYFTDVNTGYFIGSNGVILKTTNGGGSPIGIEPVSSSIPNSFELFQNYPNPFNPVTTIRFSIPNSANGRNELTTLKIFDILGKEISVPVNEILSPGEYEITWDAGNYPSGVYFCVLSSGSRSTSLKIMLVK